MRNLQILCLLALFVSCAHKKDITVNTETVKAGSKVMLAGNSTDLYNEGGNIQVGKPIDKFISPIHSPDKIKGQVAIISFVPSIDTAVCEEQTHILGEDKSIHKDILKVNISRDLPMAQTRFAKAAKLENITYVSDFKDAEFGKLSGLLMKDKGLLARGVMVTDRDGIIRYLQIVPEVTHLPDMKKAIKFANALYKSKE